MTETDLFNTGLLIAGVIAFVMGVCAYLVLAERKVAAWVQDRVGPNRVGPFGLFQPIADGGKLFLKEDVIPSHVDRVFFVLAPLVAFTSAFMAIAVVPVGSTTPPPGPIPSVKPAGDPNAQSVVERYESAQSTHQPFSFVIAPGLDIGILYTFAIGSLGVYGVILAGWSANNKYSLLGSLRSSAQIISYEIPLGLSIVGVVLLVGSLNLERIIDWQLHNGWFVLFQPLAFLLFMTSVYAECNRLPFDLPEAEQELVGGYHTEYSSSMKLGLMLFSEYIHMITVSFLMATMFFGGWHFPGLTTISDETRYGTLWTAVLRMAVLGTKMFAFVLLFLLVRWTIPRFRFDQLMGLAWKVMIPLALLHLTSAMFVSQYDYSPWILTVSSITLFVGAGLIAVWTGRPKNRPRKPRHSLPVGVPAGVTNVSR
jgi:NADH-quinone oxidoreductase subunit H